MLLLLSAAPSGLVMLWTIRKSPGRREFLKLMKSRENLPFGFQLLFNLVFITMGIIVGIAIKC